jgi:alpha-beta hydrolase superfamily lysophospholipase
MIGQMARSPDAEDTLTTFDGLKLHVETFDATPPARAVVVMVHGFSAHCGMFRHVAASLAGAGFAVTAFDCRGHGRSQGRPGYVKSFSDYADDLGRVVARARDRSPGLPLAVAAHSHGVAVTLDYLFRGVGTFDALVAAAPYLDLKMKVPLYKRMISPVMGVLWPTLTMSNEIGLDVTCSNPEARAAMEADPLIHHVATPRWFNEVRATQARLRASASSLKVPTFMPVAGDDRLIDSAVAIAFAKAAGPIVELKVYEKLFHELYLEADRDVVIADVVNWLGGRFAAGSAQMAPQFPARR